MKNASIIVRSLNSNSFVVSCNIKEESSFLLDPEVISSYSALTIVDPNVGNSDCVETPIKNVFGLN